MSECEMCKRWRGLDRGCEIGCPDLNETESEYSLPYESLECRGFILKEKTKAEKERT